jgi:hypothetical protein
VDRHKAHLDFNAALTEPYAQWLGHKWVGDPNNVTVQVDAQAAEAGRYPTPPPRRSAPRLHSPHPPWLLMQRPALAPAPPAPCCARRVASAAGQGGLPLDLQAVDGQRYVLLPPLSSKLGPLSGGTRGVPEL